MMKNNHRLQAIGLGRIGSMLRSRNEVEETSGVTNNDTDYFPKEDEDNDGEEVGDCVMEKPVFKVCKLCVLFGRCGSPLFAISFCFLFFNSCCASLSCFLAI